MGRKNHRRRPTKARWKEAQDRRPSVPAPPPIEKMVIPKGRCHFPHRKLQFTKDEAKLALEQAQKVRASRGGSGHTEQRAYECETSDKGCGYWHLTSRAKWEKR